MTAFGINQHNEDYPIIDLRQVDVNLADSLQSTIEDLKLIADLTREKANDAARLLYVASGHVDYGHFAQAKTIIENVRAALGISGRPQSSAECVSL